MLVNYDLTGKRKAFNVKLEVTGDDRRVIKPKNIKGDIGNIVQPGKDKTILWDIKADQLDITGKTLSVKVTGNVFIPGKVKKEVWIPWLYFAAGVCAASGTYAHIRSEKLYKEYQISALTNEAEKLHDDVDHMLMVRNVAFSAAGIFGVAGVMVHIRHIQKKKIVAISYIPIQNGGGLGLTCKF
jgi:hypothetical protein